MKYEAVIDAYDFGDIPKRIKLEEGSRFIVEKAQIIIKEIDSSKDPFPLPQEIEKGYSVALRVDGVRRRTEKVDELKFNIINEPDTYGEFVYLSEDAKVKDVIEAVNGFIQNIKAKGI